MEGVEGVREGVGDAVLWGEARQVDSKARARLVTVVVAVVVVVLPTAVLCEVVEGSCGCTWAKSSGVNNDVIVVGKLFWRTPYAFRHEHRIINKLGRHNDAANVT